MLLAGRALHSQARARAVDTARLSARLLDEQTRRLGDLVSALAIDLEGVQATAAGCRRATRRASRTTLGALNSREGIDFSFFTDAAGNVLLISPRTTAPSAATSPSATGTAASPRSARRTSPRPTGPRRSTARAWSPWPRGSTTGAGPAGFLVATERGQTQRFTEAFERDRGTTVTVIDQGGVIVAGSGVNDQALHARLANPAVRAALRRQGDGP